MVNSQQQSKALTLLAQMISVLLHPVFIPLISSLLWYGFYPQYFASIAQIKITDWLIMLIINTIIFPLLLILLLKGLGFIKSILMKETKERIIPLIGVMVFYFWMYYVVKNKETNAPEPAIVFFLGNYLSIIALFIATMFLKVSLHACAASFALAFAILLSIMSHSIVVPYLILVSVLAALILWARYYLKAHSVKELGVGAALGVLAAITAYVYHIL